MWESTVQRTTRVERTVAFEYANCGRLKTGILFLLSFQQSSGSSAEMSYGT